MTGIANRRTAGPGRMLIWASVALALLATTAGAAPLDRTGPADPGTGAWRGPGFAALVNETMGLRESRLIHLDLPAAPGRRFQIALELDGARVTLDLHEHGVRSADYRVYRSGAEGRLTRIEPAPVNTFRGRLRAEPGSVVAAGLERGGLSALITRPGGPRYWVEPLPLGLERAVDFNLDGVHVVYTDADVLPTDHRCGVGEFALARAEPFDAAGAAPAGSPADGAGEFFIAELALDLDSFYVSRFGEQGAQDRVNQIINVMNNEYERDVQITHFISTIIVRTQRVYFSNTIDGLLNEFRNRWLQQHGDVQRDVAELFTGRDLSGGVIGIAFLNGLCNLSIGYNVVENFGGLSCRTDLSAHELGHNWSANHCNCPNNTMNAGLTCTNVFHPTFTIPEIIAFRNSRNCLDMGSSRPPNDDCGNAMVVLDGSFDFDTSNATTDGPDLPASCDEGFGLSLVQDIWYEYIAPCDGTATASLCTSSYDTRMASYNMGGTCPASLIACNDDACGGDGLKSEVSFAVTFATHYLIRVGGFNSGGTGTLVLTCSASEACPEDLDGDGSVGFADILAVLAVWGPCQGCPEDLDGNGDVGFSDLLAVLAAWGPCP